MEGNPGEAESDGEEMPVLPKVPVKRKSLNEAKACERRTQRGRPKSASPQMEKQKTPTIDASVITQLEFGRRPQNCVSISTHPAWLSANHMLDVPSHLMLQYQGYDRCIINSIV